MRQGILFHIFSVPPASCDFPFQKPFQLFPSTLCSSVYLLILFFNVVLNSLSGMELGLTDPQFEVCLCTPQSCPPFCNQKKQKKKTTPNQSKPKTKQTENPKIHIYHSHGLNAILSDDHGNFLQDFWANTIWSGFFLLFFTLFIYFKTSSSNNSI